MLSAAKLSIAYFYCYTECHFAECGMLLLLLCWVWHVLLLCRVWHVFIVMLSIVLISVLCGYCYAECSMFYCYAEYGYAQCRVFLLSCWVSWRSFFNTCTFPEQIEIHKRFTKNCENIKRCINYKKTNSKSANLVIRQHYLNNDCKKF